MNKKVLMLRCRPTDDPFGSVQTLAWDASTKTLRSKAWVELFRQVPMTKTEMHSTDPVVTALYGMASAGNPDACEALLTYLRTRGLADFEEIELR